MIRRITAREKKIFIAALAALSLSFLYNGLVGPLQEKKDIFDQEIAAGEKQLALNRGIIQRSKALDARYDVYFSQFSRLGTSEETVSSVLSEIESVAGKLGLHVTDLKPNKIRQNEYDHQFSVSLTINSELVDIARFLYTLQQEPHLFDVEEAAFEKFMKKDQTMITTRLVLSKVFILSGSDEKGAERKEETVLYE